jgi:AbiV family abortive infection protein
LSGDSLKLTDEELRKGVKLCLDNANSLIEDAETLLDKKSYGHALFFALSAIEEISKASMYALSRVGIWKSDELDRDVICHDAKYSVFFGVLVMDAVRKQMEKGYQQPNKPLDVHDFEQMAQDFEDSIKEIGKCRKQSLYVDRRKGKWLTPIDIEREAAESWIETAKQKKTELESLFGNILNAPIEVVKTVQDYIENQLVPWAIEQFYKKTEELYQKKLISKKLYETILSSKEESE